MKDAMRTAVEEFLAELRAAWNAGDARAYAAMFAEDASYVIFLGESLMGREEIERNHVDVFRRWQRGTQMAVSPIRIQPLSGDICCVVTVGGIGKEAPIPYDKLQTFTLVRRGDRYVCAAFQNTEMSDKSRAAFN